MLSWPQKTSGFITRFMEIPPLTPSNGMPEILSAEGNLLWNGP
jgi:hypothetical protein